MVPCSLGLAVMLAASCHAASLGGSEGLAAPIAAGSSAKRQAEFGTPPNCIVGETWSKTHCHGGAWQVVSPRVMHRHTVLEQYEACSTFRCVDYTAPASALRSRVCDEIVCRRGDE